MFSTRKVVASGGGSDHDVALLFADAIHPLDGLRGLGGRFDREHEAVGQWWRR